MIYFGLHICILEQHQRKYNSTKMSYFKPTIQ